MIGEAFAVVAILCFALGNTAVAKASTSGVGGDNGALLSVVLTTVIAVVLYLALPSERPIANASGTWTAVVCFALAGVLATVLGRGTLFRSIALSGAITAGIFRRLIPVFAAMLAFVVLGETVSSPGAIGMFLIVLSILLVARGNVRSARTTGSFWSAAPEGLLYGSASAAAYGAAFVTRKLGLNHLSNAAFGALVSSLAALTVSALLILSPTRREKIVRSFTHLGRYETMAAGGLSLGQTAQFFALQHTSVTSVAVIGSLEMFVSAYFAIFVFRTEGWPSPSLILASILATAGVLMVTTL